MRTCRQANLQTQTEVSNLLCRPVQTVPPYFSTVFAIDIDPSAFQYQVRRNADWLGDATGSEAVKSAALETVSVVKC